MCSWPHQNACNAPVATLDSRRSSRVPALWALVKTILLPVLLLFYTSVQPHAKNGLFLLRYFLSFCHENVGMIGELSQKSVRSPGWRLVPNKRRRYRGTATRHCERYYKLPGVVNAAAFSHPPDQQRHNAANQIAATPGTSLC